MVIRVEKPAAPAASAAGDHQEGLATESLDDLAKTGMELDKPAAPVATPADKAALASEAKEVETALTLLRAAAVPLAPAHTHQALELVWSDSQLQEIAEAIAECAKASGITVSSWFGKHGHWIRLGFALGIPAMATVKILRTPAPAPHQVQHGQQQPA